MRKLKLSPIWAVEGQCELKKPSVVHILMLNIANMQSFRFLSCFVTELCTGHRHFTIHPQIYSFRFSYCMIMLCSSLQYCFLFQDPIRIKLKLEMLLFTVPYLCKPFSPWRMRSSKWVFFLNSAAFHHSTHPILTQSPKPCFALSLFCFYFTVQAYFNH